MKEIPLPKIGSMWKRFGSHNGSEFTIQITKIDKVTPLWGIAHTRRKTIWIHYKVLTGAGCSGGEMTYSHWKEEFSLGNICEKKNGLERAQDKVK